MQKVIFNVGKQKMSKKRIIYVRCLPSSKSQILVDTHIFILSKFSQYQTF